MTTITIDMDKKCHECGKGGACGNGICLSCITKAMQGKPMRSTMGRALQKFAAEKLEAARKKATHD